MDGIRLSDRDDMGTAPLSEPIPSSPSSFRGDISSTTDTITSFMADGKVEDTEGVGGGNDHDEEKRVPSSSSSPSEAEAEAAQAEYVVEPGLGSDDPADDGRTEGGEMENASAAVVAIGSETDGGGVDEPDAGRGQMAIEDHVGGSEREMEFDTENALEAFVPDVAPKPPEVLAAEDVQKYTDRRKLTRTMKVVILVVLTVLVGIVVGLSVGLTTKVRQVATLAPTENPDELLPSQIPTSSPAPSSSPTMFVTSVTFSLVAEQVEKEFGSQSYQMLRDDPQSPQAKAARWIGDVDIWFVFPLPLDDEEQRRHFRQRYALATFFYSTGGEESWVDHVHFLSDRHECDWSRLFVILRGTYCDASQTRVIYIDIYENNLTGSIPDEIWGVQDLEYLTLFHNQITGSIPDGIYTLSNLQGFLVPYNPLSGTISPLIGNMQNLTQFWTEKTFIKGTLPTEIGQLTQLLAISIVKSALTGTLPTEYSNLVNLRLMDLRSNRLTGTLPTWLSNHPFLVTLALGYNFFSGPIPNGTYSATESIALHNNQLTGTLPESLLSPTLGTLSVSLNSISGPLPPDWSTATNLISLDLSYNIFTGSLPTTLGLLPKLKYFFVYYNQLTGPMVNLGNSTALQFLYVEGNDFTGTIPEIYSDLPLTRFLVGNTSLTGNLTDMCASVWRPIVSANCPPQVICPCCSICYDGIGFMVVNV